MEETMHGRKVVRHGKKGSMKKANRNFLIYSITLVVIGVIIGCFVWGVSHKSKAEDTQKETELMEYVNQYGSFDGRTFTSEISLDWAGDEYEFTALDVPLDVEIQEYIFYLCKGYDLDWTLVMAMIEQESSFRPDVISATGDYGLMQINQMNHQWLTDTLGVTDYLDSEQNVRAGIFVLRKLFEEYSDPELVLMAYNMGADGASKLWEKGIYSTSYSESIIRIQKGFINQLKGE